MHLESLVNSSGQPVTTLQKYCKASASHSSRWAHTATGLRSTNTLTQLMVKKIPAGAVRGSVCLLMPMPFPPLSPVSPCHRAVGNKIKLGADLQSQCQKHSNNREARAQRRGEQAWHSRPRSCTHPGAGQVTLHNHQLLIC